MSTYPFRFLSGIGACVCAHIAGNEGNVHLSAWFGFLAGVALVVSLVNPWADPDPLPKKREHDYRA
jgi:hypothetical protein